MTDERRVTDEEALAWIGHQVSRLRNEAGMSVADLGERARLTIERLELIERGGEDPWIDDIYSLAAALRVEPSRFLEGVRWESPADTCGDGFFVVKDEDDD